jgi:hypothetical protein
MLLRATFLHQRMPHPMHEVVARAMVHSSFSSANRKLSSNALCVAILCEVHERKSTVFPPVKTLAVKCH